MYNKNKYNIKINSPYSNTSTDNESEYSGIIKKILEAQQEKKEYNDKRHRELIEKLTKKKTKKEIAQEMLDKLNNDKELKLEFEKLLRKEKLSKLDENN